MLYGLEMVTDEEILGRAGNEDTLRFAEMDKNGHNYISVLVGQPIRW